MRNVLYGVGLFVCAVGMPLYGAGCTCSPQETSKAFTQVAKTAIPAVVFVKAQMIPEQSPYGHPQEQNPFDYFGDDFFHRFFGAPPRGRGSQAPEISQGSGFFISADGYIVTNAHVVKDASKLSVTLNDGREFDVVLVGSDPHTDIAVLKVEGKDFPYLQFGDSDAMDIGEWVVAIGNPFQLEASLTVGVISAKGRQNLRITDVEDFLQTDAAINPGNSGGPLVNLSSEVIGINTAIFSRSGGYMGIGFAIPSNIARQVVAQIMDKGAFTRAFLGVSLQPVDKEIADAFGLDKAEGVLITEVVKDSPADKAGLKQGDIILEYNGIQIKSWGNFKKEISLMSPGSAIELKINRKGKVFSAPVTLGSASDSVVAAGGVVQKLGIEVDVLTPDVAKQLGYASQDEGVLITKVRPGSAAAFAGLRPGFLVLEVNDKKVANIQDFNAAINANGNKNRYLFLVKQGNVRKYYSIKVE